jgi:hypothetical protein
MPLMTELIWLANVLLFVGSMGLGWNLVSWVQQTREAEANHKRQNETGAWMARN